MRDAICCVLLFRGLLVILLRPRRPQTSQSLPPYPIFYSPKPLELRTKRGGYTISKFPIKPFVCFAMFCYVWLCFTVFVLCSCYALLCFALCLLCFAMFCCVFGMFSCVSAMFLLCFCCVLVFFVSFIGLAMFGLPVRIAASPTG